MKMDENAHDTSSMLKARQLGVMDAVAIKLSKFGGLSASRAARDLCLHLGARMCIEDTLDCLNTHTFINTPITKLSSFIG